MYTIKQNSNIAKNLRNIRKSKGFTINHVSTLTGIPKGTIGYVESYGCVSPGRLKILCDFYGIDIDWIVEEH